VKHRKSKAALELDTRLGLGDHAEPASLVEHFRRQAGVTLAVDKSSHQIASAEISSDDIAGNISLTGAGELLHVCISLRWVGDVVPFRTLE